MSDPTTEEAATAKKVKARVLVDGQYGKANSVVLVDPATLKSDNAENGLHELDGAKAAVAYAESLLG
jgi:hypothetical protein